MAYKNNVSVRIAGKTMVLSGNESVEYITKVATYIEEKAENLRMSDNSKSLNPNLISVLTSINIADDYFKERTKTENLLKEIEEFKDSNESIRAFSSTNEIFSEDKIAYESEIERLTKEAEESVVNNQKVTEELDVITEERDVLLKEAKELKQKIKTLEEEVKRQISKLNRIRYNEDKRFTPSVQEIKEQDNNKEINSFDDTIEVQEVIRTDAQNKHSGTIKNYYRNT